MTERLPAIAILYQALPPPMIGGLRKDAKPSGYADGGADIGFALAGAGHRVITPVDRPDPATELDWVFSDTAEGIAAARAAGATVLWTNTILFEGHPLEDVMGEVAIVGQSTAAMQAFDDKFATNRMLAAVGLPVARSLLAAEAARPGIHALDDLPAAIGDHALRYPLIVKPVRGRGSQGVSRVAGEAALHTAATELIAGGRFGDTLMIEEYLDGEEVTVTVMPPGAPQPGGTRGTRPWALRPVLRTGQRDGVAPYNGDVPVTVNSAALPVQRMDEPAIATMIEACVAAAELVEARAPIRIDCRRHADGAFRLFDLNMKPNMTGRGRPGRDDQDCLSLIAASAAGWSYADLLGAMLNARWRAGRSILAPRIKLCSMQRAYSTSS